MPVTLPDALLFVAPGCPHCPVVKQSLAELEQQGLIGTLTVMNVVEHPELAEQYGIRSAPWLRLGSFILTGAHSPAELRQWAEWASREEGAARYVEHLLKQGGYHQAAAYVAEDTRRLKPLLAVLADPEADIDLRLGVSALLERYADQPALKQLLPQLTELTRHSDHRTRTDACHLLGLTGSAAARGAIETCLNDVNAEVREIAAEAMERLGAA